MRHLYYYKIWQKFTTKCVRFFNIKCGSIITKCVDFVTKFDSYCKMEHLLQNASVQMSYASCNKCSIALMQQPAEEKLLALKPIAHSFSTTTIS